MRTVILLVILLLASPVWAEPFLVCKDNPKAEFYLVTLDTLPEEKVAVPLSFDLDGLENGPHSILVQAGNVWGKSDAVPFSFTKSLPEDTEDLGIILK